MLAFPLPLTPSLLPLHFQFSSNPLFPYPNDLLPQPCQQQIEREIGQALWPSLRRTTWPYSQTLFEFGAVVVLSFRMAIAFSEL